MIIITTQCFAPKIGGIESLMTGLAEALTKAGKSVLVLADGPNDNQDKNKQFKIERFNNWKPIRRIQKAKYLKMISIRENVEIIFADSWKSIELLNVKNIKIIVLAHGTEIPKMKSINFQNFFYSKINRITKSYQKIYKIIANSNYTKELILEIIGVNEKKINVVNPGIDLYKADISHKDLTKINQIIGKKSPVITTLARLEERKGHKFIIKAISKIINRFPNLLYIIAGKGPFEHQLKNYVEELELHDNVIFLGWITEPEKSILLDKSDIFAMTPIEVGESVEGFGMVYIDAALHGLPSLGTNSGGITDAIIDRETGLICEAGNQDEITKKLEALCMDKKLCINLGQKGKKISEINHSWDNKIREYLQIAELI